MSLNTSNQSRGILDTIANEIHRVSKLPDDGPPNHYYAEVARLNKLAADVTPVEFDKQTAYLQSWSVTQVLPDQWIFNLEYMVPKHRGVIHLRGVCTTHEITYDPPVYRTRHWGDAL